jgi:hypothetical protein
MPILRSGGDGKRSEPTVTLPPLPPEMKHRFHAMVKPVRALCNLDCTYCYYLGKEELLHQPQQPCSSAPLPVGCATVGPPSILRDHFFYRSRFRGSGTELGEDQT